MFRIEIYTTISSIVITTMKMTDWKDVFNELH